MRCGNTMRHYNTLLSFAVVTQYYEAEVVSEYVIRGNAAILKCTIPSFVAEFVSVESWVGSDGSTFRPSTDYGITHVHTRSYSSSTLILLSFLLKENPEGNDTPDRYLYSSISLPPSFI